MASAESGTSRFKTFKFTERPPPPPPKDPAYLVRNNNRSTTSLGSPELLPSSSQTAPASPISPSIQYAIRRANSPSPSPFSSPENNHMNQSSTSLLSPPTQQQQQQPIDATASTSTTQGGSMSGEARQRQTQMTLTKKDKALAFLKFPKRSPRTPPAAASSEDDPTPGSEDDAISLPWNFQHNIHVDEGYMGIPPSWSTSLAAAGFTEDEIAAIQARRAAGSRSPPDLRYLYSERPNSPAVAVGGGFPFPTTNTAPPPFSSMAPPMQQSHSLPNPQLHPQGSPSLTSAFSPPGVPVLTHPTPRSTSLHRLASSPGESTTPLAPTATAASASNPSYRVPPPKRKPPASPLHLDEKAKSSQEGAESIQEVEREEPRKHRVAPSISSVGYSSESHYSVVTSEYHQDPNQTANTTFAGLNDSFAYKYNPEDTTITIPPVPPLPKAASTSSLASSSAYLNPPSRETREAQKHDQAHTPTPTPLASSFGARLRSGSNAAANAFSSTGAGPSTSTTVNGQPKKSKFKVVNGDRNASGSSSTEDGVEEIIKSKSFKDLASAASSSSTSLPAAPVPDLPPHAGEKGHQRDASISGTSNSHSHSNSYSTSQASHPSSSTSHSGHGFFNSISHSLSNSLHSHSHNTSNPPASTSAVVSTSAAASASTSAFASSSASTSQPTMSSSLPASSSLTSGWLSPSLQSSFATPGAPSGWKASASSLAGGLVGAVKSKVLGRNGSGGSDKEKEKEKTWLDKGKDKERLDEGVGGSGSGSEAGLEKQGEDEEFLASEEPGNAGRSGPAVWEMYTRPRASTDVSRRGPAEPPAAASASTSGSGSAGMSNANAGASASTHSLVSSSQTPAFAGLRRKPSNADSNTNMHGRKRSQSQSSLRSQRSAGSLRVGIGGQYQKQNASMTSLESIPEASPAPGAVLVGRNGSRGRGRSASNAVNGVYGNSSINGPSGSSTSVHSNGVAGPSGSSSTNPSPLKKAPAYAPRLSLHQHNGSDDLSSWSEALLSGIGDAGAGGGLGLDFGLFGKEFSVDDRAKGKEWNGFGVGRLKDAEKDTPRSAPASGAGAVNMFRIQQHAAAVARARGAPGHAQTMSVSQPSTGTNTGSTSTTTTTRLVGRKFGQPIPSSKPPPRLPVPSRPDQAGPAPLPLPPVGAGAAGRSRSNSRSGSGRNSTTLGTLPQPLPLNTQAKASSMNAALSNTHNSSSGGSNALPPQTAGMLSPTSLADQTSPAGSSAGPDSAQLWNEIEQMMDPGMMSAIPGLHLSVALPPGAQGVLKSAGLGSFGQGGSALANIQAHSSLPSPPVGVAALATRAQDRSPAVTNANSKDPQTVGDLVGSSPAFEETFSPTLPFTPEEERVAGVRKAKAEGAKGTVPPPAAKPKPKKRGRTLKDALAMEMEDEGDEDEGDDSDGSVYSNEEEDDGSVERPRFGQAVSRKKAAAASASDANVNGRMPSASRSRERDNLMVDARDTNRDSTRSSTSTLTVTSMHVPTTIVRNVSIARRAGAYVIDQPSRSPVDLKQPSYPPSPLNSQFVGGGGSSEDSGGSSNTSSSSPLQEQPLTTPTTTDGGVASPLLYYLDGAQTPSPTPDKISFGQQPLPPLPRRLPVINDRHNEYVEEEDDDYEPYPDEETMQAVLAANGGAPPRPTIVINDAPPSARPPIATATTATSSTNATPLSPFQRYRGWLSAVVAPLEEFIDETVDPRDHYLDLTEIAEGESGSVFAAVLNPVNAGKLRLPPLVKAQDAEELVNNPDGIRLVAIKSVAIVPSGSPKLVDLQKELSLMRGLSHENVLGMDGVYVDLVEDSLWVRMELMERSLADIIGLVGNGLMLQDRMIARFASDVLHALDFLLKHNIAHRDVRSDNLLLNKHGVLKLADFSNAVQVTQHSPMRSDIVGVAFWQAPEVRRPPYNTLKVDVWSLGATVWEMAQTEPPFAETQQLAERWPPLRQPELYSPAFHDFLRKCSEPVSLRPGPTELFKSSFINNACGRQVIVQLLSQCMAIEGSLQEETIP
ncbi:unnamed protein product [Cyclocybe aegerita]|uniref:Uncharacterized protein n=1 Tax=Cyclocybe aegerita TaxID=1973307 RepID=A0A8S0VYA4_CYCAE|nr:unnamed protein product [Cyclocybe aegerita]